MRLCRTCHHLKRPDIDRRLAGGEPLTHLAKDYGLSQSSLYRHRTNCLNLASSNAIKKEAARGSAAVALLPSKETLTGAYNDLREHIDRIVTQAESEGSLRIALTGLSSVRQTLDSLSRLAAKARSDDTGKQARDTPQVDVNQISESLIKEFDREPEIKRRLASVLLAMENKAPAETKPAPRPEGAVAASEDGCERSAAPALTIPTPAPGLAAALTASQVDHATVARALGVAGNNTPQLGSQAGRQSPHPAAEPGAAAGAVGNGPRSGGAIPDGVRA